jgi:hypothetical protein
MVIYRLSSKVITTISGSVELNTQSFPVIRIFGIYTHAQLDGRFWDSMSFQLAKRGKEYQRR